MWCLDGLDLEEPCFFLLFNGSLRDLHSSCAALEQALYSFLFDASLLLCTNQPHFFHRIIPSPATWTRTLWCTCGRRSPPSTACSLRATTLFFPTRISGTSSKSFVDLFVIVSWKFFVSKFELRHLVAKNPLLCVIFRIILLLFTQCSLSISITHNAAT